MITVDRYDAAADSRDWNCFVADSRNATFMFDRRYMDYHADRFADHSLVARDGHGRLLALLPACREGDTLYSHRGLTFGGWLLPGRRCNALDMLELWDVMTARLRGDGIRRLVYKAVPHIYHRRPAEEDIYAIFRAGGSLTTSLISSAVDLRDPIAMDQGSRRCLRKALASGRLDIGPSDAWVEFWQVLTRLLAERYGSRPVHTLDEIELLRSRFPDNIRLYAARDTADGSLVAGTVLYVSQTVVHSQYIAASPVGKELSALPAIFSRVVDDYTGRANWLDFGTSNEDNGLSVNSGLLRQKCSYGGRGIVYNTYTIPIG